MINIDYEGISLRELADPALHNWVHHMQHILPQVEKYFLNMHIKSILMVLTLV